MAAQLGSHFRFSLMLNLSLTTKTTIFLFVLFILHATKYSCLCISLRSSAAFGLRISHVSSWLGLYFSQNTP
jgi:hypothetical protein